MMIQKLFPDASSPRNAVRINPMKTSSPLTLDELLLLLPDHYILADRELIQRAYHLAEKAHAGQKRASGEPYINHCLAVAAILAEFSMPAEVVAAADSAGAGGMLVFDSAGVTGHQDHVAATAAGLLAAEMLNLPVLGWTLPEPVAAQLNQELGASFVGHRDQEIDLRVSVERTRQRLASHAHKSQALPSSVLWRRLELLGDSESLRWLHGPLGATVTP